MQELLRKRDQLRHADVNIATTNQIDARSDDEAPTPMIFRSTTANEEIIHPPSSPEFSPSPSRSPQRPSIPDHSSSPSLLPSPRTRFRPSLHIRRWSKNNANDLSPNEEGGSLSPMSPTGTGRSLSDRMKRLSFKPRSRTTSASSVHVPEDLPDIAVTNDAFAISGEEHEAEWERRAALLAQHQRARAPSASTSAVTSRSTSPLPSRGLSPAPVSAETVDAQIQQAISLHESGELEQSTAIFRTLANPNGANNPFSQTLYGLALQHGWGCAPDPKSALHYHTLAASNSADIGLPTLQEKLTTTSEPTRPASTTSNATRTAARGELVLAIYELGNTFRHGLGCAVDPVAARRYYETAAELGDADAMVEAAWCYENGFGGSKDKWRAARYLRMAEVKGVRMVGNSWIYKDKYMTAVPGKSGKEKKVKKDKDRDKEKA